MIDLFSFSYGMTIGALIVFLGISIIDWYFSKKAINDKYKKGDDNYS